MKRFFLILSFALTSCTVLFAQDDSPDEDNTGRLRERMQQYIQKRLNMSKSEAERFSPIFLRYITDLRKTHRENRTDRPVLQLRIAELRVRYRNEFKQVLDEQRANRIFLHQREFEDKVRKEILDRQQSRQGGGRRRNLP
jgi:hypothetical protein